MPPKIKPGHYDELIKRYADAVKKEQALRRLCAQPANMAVASFFPALIITILAHHSPAGTLEEMFKAIDFILPDWLVGGLFSKNTDLYTRCANIIPKHEAIAMEFSDRLCPQLRAHILKILDSDIDARDSQVAQSLRAQDKMPFSDCLNLYDFTIKTLGAPHHQVPEILATGKEMVSALRQLLKTIEPLGPKLNLKQYRSLPSNEAVVRLGELYLKNYMKPYDDICLSQWVDTKVKSGMYIFVYVLIPLISFILYSFTRYLPLSVFMPRLSAPLPPLAQVLEANRLVEMVSLLDSREKELESYANYVVKSMRLLSLVALPFAIAILIESDKSPTLATLLLIILSIASTNLVRDFSHWRNDIVWRKHIGILGDLLTATAKPLNVSIVIYNEENEEACTIELQHKNNALLGISKKKQFLCLTSALKQLDIDFVICRGKVILEEVKTLNSKKLTSLHHIIANQIGRRSQLETLLKQLFQLQRYKSLDFCITPCTDEKKLPTMRCGFLINDKIIKEKIQQTYPHNTFSVDNSVLTMYGYCPADPIHLCELHTVLKQQERPAVTCANGHSAKTDATIRATLTLPPQGTRRAGATLTEDEVIDEKITIAWASGYFFDSNAENDKVKAITSPFLTNNTRFIAFELTIADFEHNEITDKEFRDKFKEARLVRRENGQGLVLCDEYRSCWQYQWRQDGRNWRPVARKRLRYDAKLKIKLLGKHGNERCYALAETSTSAQRIQTFRSGKVLTQELNTGQIIYRVVEYDPMSH